MTTTEEIEKLSIAGLLAALEANLNAVMAKRSVQEPLMIGIHTGGVWVAEYLHERLALNQPLGLLDISFYRDDYSQVGVNPNVKPSQLPPDIDNRDLILVDDVFQTGRTVRAALNEIFDYGRPNQVILATLIERDGKQIPICPDCIGKVISLPKNQRIKLTGPKPLGIEIQTINAQS